jgi:uncharacterized membrane protein
MFIGKEGVFMFIILLVALLLGVVSGLRTFTAPAVVSWAAHLGSLPLAGSALAFMGYEYSPYIFTLLALGELIQDKRANTPSRKTPPQFFGRIMSGALVGASIGAGNDLLFGGMIAGICGAIFGTLDGAAARAKLASVFHRDLPAALIEDATAIGVGILVIAKLP